MSETFTAGQVEATRVTLTGLSRSTTMDAWTVAAIGKAVPMLRALAARLRVDERKAGFTCIECGVTRPEACAEDRRWHLGWCSRFDPAKPAADVRQSSFPPSTAQEIAQIARTPGPIIDVPDLNDPDDWTGEYRTQRAAPERCPGRRVGTCLGQRFHHCKRDVGHDDWHVCAGCGFDFVADNPLSTSRPEAVPGVQEPERSHKCQDGATVPWSVKGCGVCGNGSEEPGDTGYKERHAAPEPLPGLAEVLDMDHMARIWRAYRSGIEPDRWVAKGYAAMRGVIVQILTPWLAAREASLTARIAELEYGLQEAEACILRQADENVEKAGRLVNRQRRAEQAEAALTELAEKAQAVSVAADKALALPAEDNRSHPEDAALWRSVLALRATIEKIALAALPKESR